MIRVVVDPGVFVSVLIGPRGSPPDRIFSAWVDDRLEIVASPQLIAELRQVTLRPRFRRWFDEASARQLVARIELHATIHADPPQPKSATRDPKDDYLVALAQAAKVDVIVSGDHDCTPLSRRNRRCGHHAGSRTVSPRQPKLRGLHNDPNLCRYGRGPDEGRTKRFSVGPLSEVWRLGTEDPAKRPGQLDQLRFVVSAKHRGIVSAY